MFTNWKRIYSLLIWLLFTVGCIDGDSRGPSRSELSSWFGQPVQVNVAGWSAALDAEVAPVYSVDPVAYDPEMLQKWAMSFGLEGDIEPLPADFTDGPGYWIKKNELNSHYWKEAAWYTRRTGWYGYGNADTGFRWDPKERVLNMNNVPDFQKAIELAVGRLKSLNISSNVFQKAENGKLKFSETLQKIKYVPGGKTTPETVVKSRGISFTQGLPSGELYSVGRAGTLGFTFIDNGKVSEGGIRLARFSVWRSVELKDKPAILKGIRNGEACGKLPESLKAVSVEKCELIYPYDGRQQLLWPFFKLTCSTEGREIWLFLPAYEE